MDDSERQSTDAAKALSVLGAAKGGKARAKKLTAEQRSEIARSAVEARWEKAGKKPLPRASHTGALKFGEVSIPCAVLEDGTRVLWQQGFLRAIGRTGRAAESAMTDESSQLPVFLRADNLKPFISEEVREASTPIPFRGIGIISSRGGVAYGYKADLLPQVCSVFLDAADKGVLRTNQRHIYERCKILVRGLATVGITALIDEATGYQDERARDALAKILEAFIAKELRAWVRTFPTDFYKEMFRLRSIPYREDVKRPQYIGVLTNDLVYSRLAPGVLDELRRLTPRDEKGRLKTHLHRRLTEDVGHPKLQQHLSAVTALMKVSDSWEQFKPMVDRALPKYKRLPLFDGLDPKETSK
jgi:hypothetical protein